MATIHQEEVLVTSGDVSLEGSLAIPGDAAGVVLFAHGSGSSRLSLRNGFVAKVLNGGGIATLLFNLLTREETQFDLLNRQYQFDIPLLASRLIGAIDWVACQDLMRGLPLGLFGSSTGAAAALIAAAERPAAVKALVARGGRPDLAGRALPHVQAPTLMIVGALDTGVITLNERARSEMKINPSLEIVPGAGHLFEQAGTLEEVARLSLLWFREKLASARDPDHGHQR